MYTYRNLNSPFSIWFNSQHQWQDGKQLSSHANVHRVRIDMYGRAVCCQYAYQRSAHHPVRHTKTFFRNWNIHHGRVIYGSDNLNSTSSLITVFPARFLIRRNILQASKGLINEIRRVLEHDENADDNNSIEQARGYQCLEPHKWNQICRQKDFASWHPKNWYGNFWNRITFFHCDTKSSTSIHAFTTCVLHAAEKYPALSCRCAWETTSSDELEVLHASRRKQSVDHTLIHVHQWHSPRSKNLEMSPLAKTPRRWLSHLPVIGKHLLKNQRRIRFRKATG